MVYVAQLPIQGHKRILVLCGFLDGSNDTQEASNIKLSAVCVFGSALTGPPRCKGRKSLDPWAF